MLPKVVDHGVRRRELAGAVMRLAASRGLGAISLRHVAAEAGVSMGLVQHYFASKDELFRFAIMVVDERVQERLARAVPDLGERESSPELVEMLLRELLPFDEERRLEGHAGLAYAAYSATRPELSLVEQTRQLLRFIADDLRRHGAVPAAEAEVRANVLVSVVEGLSMHILTGHLTVPEGEQAFAAAFATAYATSNEKEPS